MNEDDLLKNKTEQPKGPESNEQRSESVEEAAVRSCSEIDQEVNEFAHESRELMDNTNKTVGLNEAIVAEIVVSDGVESGLTAINAEAETLAETSKQEIIKYSQTEPEKQNTRQEISQKEKEKKDLVATVMNPTQLPKVIQSLGEFDEDGITYSAPQLMTLLKGVADDTLDISVMPSKFGLREKVASLFSEFAEVDINNTKQALKQLTRKIFQNKEEKAEIARLTEYINNRQDRIRRLKQ
jgi:hypothetical protein